MHWLPNRRALWFVVSLSGLFALLTGSPTWAAACDGFTDVDSAASYCTAVVYLKDHGITLGCTGTAYCPESYVTRAQMALFLQRMGRADPSNMIGDHSATIAGGTANVSAAVWNTVGGGYTNSASGTFGTIAGGQQNIASASNSTVIGGLGNSATGAESSALGGSANEATGNWSVTLGGFENDATGVLSIGAGHSARADQQDCAIFALWSTNAGFGCNGWANVLRIGADNGMSVDYGGQSPNGNSVDYVYIGPKVFGHAISTGTGAYLSTGGAWSNGSDRNSKTDVVPIDTQAVLDKVAALPISQWRYKVENGQIHLGPMAQDFHAAFGLGADDTHITTVDEGGVALAAIQALHARLKDKDAQINALSRRLEAVEGMLKRHSP